MDSFVSGTLEWKVLIWILGAILILSIALIKARKFSPRLAKLYAQLQPRAERVLRHVDRRHGSYASIIGAIFLFIFCFAKWSQLRANELHSQDFWLFVDLIEQGARGGLNLTRFAPQSAGWTQHGAVHAFLPMILLVPLAWWIPAKWIALYLNPFALVGASVLIFLLAKKIWRPSMAILLMVSFLLSSYVGKVLMFETHPESLYPLLLLGWAWAIRLTGPFATSRTILPPWRKVAIYLAVFLLLTLKEDVLLVFFPFVLLAVLSLRKEQQEAALGSLVIGLFAYAIQLFALNQWARGNWGPELWDNFAVYLPPAAGAQGADQSWASISKIMELIQQLWEKSGGLAQVPLALLKFLLSRPFLTLLVCVPWIGIRFSFWLCVLPLSFLYCLNPGPAHLWNYYSAPFLSVFWLSAILAGQSLSVKARNRAAVWTLMATCVFGAGGPTWYLPSAKVTETATALNSHWACLEKSQKMTEAPRGFVGAGLIASLSDQQRQFLLYDRAPDDGALKNISFALFDPQMERFENSRESLQNLYRKLSASSEWAELDATCKTVVNAPESNPAGIRLFIRKSH